ncbi:MAG: type II toxin-antitoxin system RelE/ParE family toxin [Planctomycetota bacterium]
MPTAERDLRRLSPDIARRIIDKVAGMEEDLHGDVKRLTELSPAYRLRIGDWRVLFDVDDSLISIFRVLHRSKAYE